MRALPLAAILVLGAALRLFGLWWDAPPLYADELDQDVSVRSILTTGVDIDGTLQPFLDSNLERHPPVYGITAYLSTRVLGEGPFGWRFPAAAFGVLSIALLYLIVLELTGRRTIALIAAFLFAIEPIQVHFSRIGWEPATVLPFLLGGLWLLLTALREARPAIGFARLTGAAVLFGLCPYTYGATWFYAAILAGALIVVNAKTFRERGNRMRLTAAAAIALAIATPALLMQWTDPHTTERATQIATFHDGINRDTLAAFFSHYAAHFGWPYLFASGALDPHYMAGYGAMYWWYGPLIVAGLVYAESYVRSRALLVWTWIWLLAYPLGGAPTNDVAGAHPARTIAGSPVLCIFAAIGCYALFHIGRLIESTGWRRRYRIGFAAALAACAIGSLASFANWYFRIYPVVTAAAWDSGARDAFAAVRANERGYTTLCLIGFNPWHIDTLQRYYLPERKLTVVEDGNDPRCRDAATLVLSSRSLPLPGFAVMSTSYGLDGSPFAVLEARAPVNGGLASGGAGTALDGEQR
jgi:4-amino-4-deoxy-L-arabinose transferase-like glycosyltransferase